MKRNKYMTGIIVGAAAGGAIGALVENMALKKSFGKSGKRMLRKAGSFFSGML